MPSFELYVCMYVCMCMFLVELRVRSTSIDNRGCKEK